MLKLVWTSKLNCRKIISLTCLRIVAYWVCVHMNSFLERSLQSAKDAKKSCKPISKITRKSKIGHCVLIREWRFTFWCWWETYIVTYVHTSLHPSIQTALQMKTKWSFQHSWQPTINRETWVCQEALQTIILTNSSQCHRKSQFWQHLRFWTV